MDFLEFRNQLNRINGNKVRGWRVKFLNAKTDDDPNKIYIPMEFMGFEIDPDNRVITIDFTQIEDEE